MWPNSAYPEVPCLQVLHLGRLGRQTAGELLHDLSGNPGRESQRSPSRIQGCQRPWRGRLHGAFWDGRGQEEHSQLDYQHQIRAQECHGAHHNSPYPGKDKRWPQEEACRPETVWLLDGRNWSRGSAGPALLCSVEVLPVDNVSK